jgi:bifunctional enzyme CysN/CysC
MEPDTTMATPVSAGQAAAQDLTPPEEGGVIWVTGYSGAGKTTIGRKVEGHLRQSGLPTVFLDGDDLRRIFAGKWGYSRAERLELAKVYFRLCSHLTAQRITVVISAIAMYAEIYDWVAANIPRLLVVYLRVPETERIRRDRGGKNVYGNLKPDTTGYDEPRSADLVVDNFGDTEPADAAGRIVRLYAESLRTRRSEADHGKTAHWDSFYRRDMPLQEPSGFARHVAQTLLAGKERILDVGCGNGRDSAYFSSLGHPVSAIDTSAAAVELCRSKLGHLPISFHRADADAFARQHANQAFDVVYCRFALQAMTAAEEVAFIRGARELLRPDGRLLIECRSIADPLSRLGEIISPTERIHGHYRRFIVLDELVSRLEGAGFAIDSAVEANGLAVFANEDPVVIRLVARR